jgi:hypothetical protein
MTLLSLCVALADPGESFRAANDLLASGDLAGAEAGYRALIADGLVDADLYYNLGNVLFREEQVPLALLAWRRSALLAPRDPDVQANLEFARRGVVDDLAASDPAPVWAPWQVGLTAAEGQWLGCALAGVGLLAAAVRGRRPSWPLGPVGVALTGLGGMVAAGGLAEEGMPPSAVVLAAEIRASSDLGGGVDLFVLHAGAEVGVRERAAGRSLVVLPDGRQGWVADENLGFVDVSEAMPRGAAPVPAGGLPAPGPDLSPEPVPSG